MTSNTEPLVVRGGDVRGHFHESVLEALDHLEVEASEAAASYLVNLLAAFVRTERLFMPGSGSRWHRPLAEIYAEAVADPRPRQRFDTLRRLGDLALFVAGVFLESLNRRVVDVDYYIAMGGNAYASLARSPGSPVAGDMAPLFDEMARKFGDFVDVLNEVSEAGVAARAPDLLRLHELWMRTGSRRAARRLRELGLEPQGMRQWRRH